jgi:hypothetical protein
VTELAARDPHSYTIDEHRQVGELRDRLDNLAPRLQRRLETHGWGDEARDVWRAMVKATDRLDAIMLSAHAHNR